MSGFMDFFSNLGSELGAHLSNSLSPLMHPGQYFQSLLPPNPQAQGQGQPQGQGPQVNPMTGGVPGAPLPTAFQFGQSPPPALPQPPPMQSLNVAQLPQYGPGRSQFAQGLLSGQNRINFTPGR